jgi:hypothetical protein
MAGPAVRVKVGSMFAHHAVVVCLFLRGGAEIPFQYEAGKKEGRSGAGAFRRCGAGFWTAGDFLPCRICIPCADGGAATLTGQSPASPALPGGYRKIEGKNRAFALF